MHVRIKNGFALVILLIAGGMLTGLFVTLAVYGPNLTKGLGLFSQKKSGQISEATDDLNKQKGRQVPIPSPFVFPTLAPSPNASENPQIKDTIFKHAQGKYSITLPGIWKVDSTIESISYSTTKFTGEAGNLSITFGLGKPPIGGCSETTNISLSDRTIAGCLLMQKDGSQILSRAYTTNSSGENFTIEGYINPPADANRPELLEILKTLDIG